MGTTSVPLATLAYDPRTGGILEPKQNGFGPKLLCSYLCIACIFVHVCLLVLFFAFCPAKAVITPILHF